MGEFKMGAFHLARKTRTKIVPVTIMGTNEAMGPGMELQSFDASAKIRVVIHEPIEVSDDVLPAEELRDRVRGVILKEILVHKKK